jgi:hypothetical protein
MSEPNRTTCPHCDSKLLKLGLPDAAFDHDFDLVCFNDDCSYYVRGWVWMEQQYGVKTSYRYRIEPRNGHASPIPVWSPSALRNCILPDDPPEPGGS